MAVLAGVVAQVASDKLGDIGPFQVCVYVCMMCATALIRLLEMPKVHVVMS